MTEKKRYPQIGDLIAYNVDKLAAYHKAHRSKEDNKQFWTEWVENRDVNLLVVIGRSTLPLRPVGFKKKDLSHVLLLQPIRLNMTRLPPVIYEHESLFDIVVSAKKDDS